MSIIATVKYLFNFYDFKLKTCLRVPSFSNMNLLYSKYLFRLCLDLKLKNKELKNIYSLAPNEKNKTKQTLNIYFLI